MLGSSNFWDRPLSGNFKNIKNTLEQFIPNRPPKYMVVHTNLIVNLQKIKFGYEKCVMLMKLCQQRDLHTSVFFTSFFQYNLDCLIPFSCLRCIKALAL